MLELKFTPLIINQKLIINRKFLLNSTYLKHILACDFYFDFNQVYSCFVLSVDGKLNFHDQKSGFLIAKNNFKALPIEKTADFWWLNLARSLADGVIIGSQSIINEAENYSTKVLIPELKILRQELGKAKIPWQIIITRDLKQFNFKTGQIFQANDIPVIIFSLDNKAQLPEHFQVTSKVEPLLKQQIIYLTELNLKSIIKQLNTAQIKSILNESTYWHHRLQEEALLKEAWINNSLVYIGGEGITLGHNNQAFNSIKHPHYTILSLHHIGYNFLYTRYAIEY